MSIEKVTMPQLGESVTEGTLSKWLVKQGEKIEKYDPLAEVMSDKVNTEIPSSFSGTIQSLELEEGETVQVGEVICIMETEDDASSNTETEKDVQAVPKEKRPEQAETSMKSRYSPAVLRLAQENDIALTQLTGSGKGGRITRRDVEQYIQQGSEIPEKEGAPPKSSISANEIPVTGVRKAIADKMVKSVTEIPHAWMQVEVDVTELVKLRNKHKEGFREKEGVPLTYFPFFLKAVSQALSEFPALNSTWEDNKIIQHPEIHLSIAVAKDDELHVPVLRDVDEKSIKGIAKETYRLSQAVQNNQLTGEDMSGGTFTVNNTGSFGSVSSMGIINHPQAAILQVESIVKRPVIINDMFAARDIVNLSLSLDHRILDGLVCGKFMQRIKQILEQMDEKTISLY